MAPDAADLRIFGIAGSLRAGSYNLALLRAAGEILPPGVSLEIGRIDDIPLYNADVQSLGDPAPVARLKKQIEDADALLIATPETTTLSPGCSRTLSTGPRVRPRPAACAESPSASWAARAGIAAPYEGSWRCVRCSSSPIPTPCFNRNCASPERERVSTRTADWWTPLCGSGSGCSFLRWRTGRERWGAASSLLGPGLGAGGGDCLARRPLLLGRRPDAENLLAARDHR